MICIYIYVYYIFDIGWFIQIQAGCLSVYYIYAAINRLSMLSDVGATCFSVVWALCHDCLLEIWRMQSADQRNPALI